MDFDYKHSGTKYWCKSQGTADAAAHTSLPSGVNGIMLDEWTVMSYSTAEQV